MRTSEVISAIPGTIACCISTGLAGSLKPEYEIGQVLASRTVFSEEAPEDFPGGVLAGSPALISFAEMYGAKVVDRFHSTARVITRANEKLYLGRSADAVEMESFEVLRGAAASGIPAVAIRSISDLAGEDLPLDTVEIFNDRGQVSYPRVIGQIARHPNKVSGFMRLGQQSKLAAESLARFLDSYVLGLAEKASLLDFNAEGAMRAAQP